MGIVYEATQLSLNRKVALKLIASELGDDFGYRNRFEREGRIQAAIDHPHIITVYEAGESKYGLFIAMRLIRGSTLKNLILGRELDAGRSLRILGQVADALDTAHEAGLIHRDVKPQNILVSQARDHGYLADFGVMKGRGGTNLTQAGQIVGTIDYMAPEQIRGEQATQASDIYGLAAVLYECFTGTVPYPKESDVAVIYAHISEPPPRVSEVRPEMPQALDAVIERAMAKNPAERYPTAVSMVDAADEALGQATRAAIHIPAPVERPEEIGIRRPEGVVTTAASQEARQAAEGPPTMAAPATPPAVAAKAAATPSTPEAARVAAPAPAAVRRRISLPLALGTAAGVLLLAGVGFVSGRQTSESDPPPSPPSARTISKGPATLVVPAGWNERAPGRIPGLALQQAAAVSPAPGSADQLVWGRARQVWPHYLPGSFVRRLRSRNAVNRRDIVRIGRSQALRYRNLRVRGLSSPVSLYVVPMRSRSATFACLARSASFRASCEERLAGARIRGRAISLTPSAAYARAVTRAVGAAAAERAAGLRLMRRSQTASGQAGGARRVSAAYAAGARRLRRTATSALIAPANRDIAAAFSSVGSAYNALASAASGADGGRYAAARRRARSAEARLQTTIAGLRRIGFTIR